VAQSVWQRTTAATATTNTVDTLTMTKNLMKHKQDSGGGQQPSKQ